MPSAPVSGTAEAEALVVQYESLSFADADRQVRHPFPTEPRDVVDIGAALGRDTAGSAFAKAGTQA